jgi:endonuclease VIII
VAEADARMVYKQTDCRACGTPVESWTLEGRTAYACPRCQPR